MKFKISLKTKFSFMNSIILGLVIYVFMSLAFNEFEKLAVKFSDDVVEEMEKAMEIKLENGVKVVEKVLENQRKTWI